jgi:two-component system, LytTR family, response regulator
MIRAVIIDDESHNITNLSKLLERHCPEVRIEGTALNATEGKALIDRVTPELLFLDISMPGGTGFDLLRTIAHADFEIIFVTAFHQYGIQAVKFSALDYLLKPIDPVELKSAVEKAIINKDIKQRGAQLENLIELLKHQQQKDEHRIALPGAKETRFVRPAQIIRCEAENNYTFFYLSEGSKIVVSQPIYVYEELLKDYGFMRCHQSHLVNKRFVRSWMKEDGGYLVLEDQSTIPVSRQKKELIRAWLGY